MNTWLFFRLPFLRFKHTKGAKERSFWSDSTKRNAQKGWKELTLILTKRYRTQHTKSNAYSNQTVQNTKQNKKQQKRHKKVEKHAYLNERIQNTTHKSSSKKKKKAQKGWKERLFERKDTKHKRLKTTLILIRQYKIMLCLVEISILLNFLCVFILFLHVVKAAHSLSTKMVFPFFFDILGLFILCFFAHSPQSWSRMTDSGCVFFKRLHYVLLSRAW